MTGTLWPGSCAQCHVPYVQHPAGNGLDTCPGDFEPDPYEAITCIEHCPRCGSDDLALWGDTEARTDQITDHIECHDCKWAWHRPELRT